jgi:hypothetical protein
MAWLKRNIIWLVGGLVSLGMIGGATVFTLEAKKKQEEAVNNLSTYTNTVNRLKSAKPYPSTEMVQKLEGETVAVRSFIDEAEKMFVYEEPQRMPGQEFKVHLINSLVKLRTEATNFNVELPPNFNFTFTHLLPMPNLLPYSVKPLQVQLRDIEEIAQVLFESRIHGLEAFSRVPAYAREPGSKNVLVYDMGVRTNLTTDKAVFTSTPYKFTFRGFTTELTEVLNRFARAKRFYVVKRLEVETVPPKVDPGGAMLAGGRMDEGSMMESGDPSNMTAAQRINYLERARQNARRGMVPTQPQFVTIVNERPLRVKMVVDVVKLIRKPEPAAN